MAFCTPALWIFFRVYAFLKTSAPKRFENREWHYWRRFGKQWEFIWKSLTLWIHHAICSRITTWTKCCMLTPLDVQIITASRLPVFIWHPDKISNLMNVRRAPECLHRALQCLIKEEDEIGGWDHKLPSDCGRAWIPSWTTSWNRGQSLSTMHRYHISSMPFKSVWSGKQMST